jgi:hypothetical protein
MHGFGQKSRRFGHDFCLHVKKLLPPRVRLARKQNGLDEFLSRDVSANPSCKSGQMFAAKATKPDRQVIKGTDVVFDPYHMWLSFSIQRPDLLCVRAPNFAQRTRAGSALSAVMPNHGLQTREQMP